jgi:hypothetical protein
MRTWHLRLVVIGASLAETSDASGGSLDLIEDVDLVGSGLTATVIDGNGGEFLDAVLDMQATSTEKARRSRCRRYYGGFDIAQDVGRTSR